MYNLKYQSLIAIFFMQLLYFNCVTIASPELDKTAVYGLQYVQTAVPVDYDNLTADQRSDILPAISTLINARLKFTKLDTNYDGNKVFLSGVVSYEIVSGPFGDGMDAKLSVKSADANFTLVSAGKGQIFECELTPIGQQELLYNPTLVRGIQSLAVALVDTHGVELYSGEMSRTDADGDSQHVTMASPSEGNKIGWVIQNGKLSNYYQKVNRILERSELSYEYASVMTVRRMD